MSVIWFDMLRSPLQLKKYRQLGNVPMMETEQGTPPSKSELKRRALGLQELGRELTVLKPAQLSELPLPDKLASAILDYQRFPSRGAKRRQLQYIGRLMRDLDVGPIEAALDDLRGQSAEAQYLFHLLERWRDRLIESPDEAMTAFLDDYPEADRQALRHQLQRVQRAGTEEQQRAAARTLFRFLRETVQAD
jgi:ribosome-associated protein